MGDTIQQAIGSLSAGSPEFKRALKVLIKYEIHCLLQRLSDTGEEAIVITTSLEDGSQEQLGTNAGEGFLRHTERQLHQLKQQFLRYCTDKASGDGESSTSKPTTKRDSGGDSMVEEDEDEGPRQDGGESQGGDGEMTPNKPVDFSWSVDKVNLTCQGDNKGEVVFSDRSNSKDLSLATPNNYMPKTSVGFDAPKCKLTPSIQDMAHLFNSATICGKSDYEESEVQDLSIHQRGSNAAEKSENPTTPSPKSRRKKRTSTASDDRESIACSPNHLMPSSMYTILPGQRRPSKSSSGDECVVTNGGLYKIQPGHVEGATVIPRCHLDLSVSRIVENLSKAVGEKWTEDDYELDEMGRDGKGEANENDDKSGPVYFKCTESSLNLKYTDSICSKSSPGDFSGSEDVLSWRHENQSSRHAGPTSFDSWVPAALKKESDKVDGCKTEEQIFAEQPDIGIKSEIKIEPDFGEGTSAYEKMDQSPGSGKYLNPTSGQGATPIQLNFICKICGQNFRNRQYRDFHVKLHKSPHIFLCHLCSAGFNSEAECSEHQKLHTDPIYQCDNCGYRCTREFRMRAHKEICGEPAKIYKCPFCDKQFAAQRYMRIHMKSHDTRNIHTCPHCQNTYPLKNSLLKHIKKKHSA